MKGTIRRLFGRTASEQRANIGDLVDDVPRGKGASAAQGRDDVGRMHLEDKIVGETQRRNFLRAGLLGAAGAGALGFLLTHRAGADLGDAQGGTHIDPNDIVSKRIAGVRIATEFDSAKHAGTSGDPFLATAISAAWADMPALVGGAIVMGNVIFNAATTPVTFAIGGDSGAKLFLQGMGPGTQILWSGSGYGVVITGVGSPGNQRAVAQDFRLDGISVTTGRHGLQVGSMANQVYINRVQVRNCDVAFNANDVSQVVFDDIIANGVNTGLLTGTGGFSAPNMIRILNSLFSVCAVRAINLEGGSQVVVEGNTFETNAIGIRIGGTSDSYAILSNYHEAATTRDILIAGSPINVVVDGERSNSTCAYFMEIDAGVRVSLRNVKTTGHTTAVYYIPVTSALGLYIENPYFTESLFIDSGAQTSVTSRLAGTVILERVIGEVVRITSAVVVGDVVFPTGTGIYDATSGTGAKRPKPVLIGGSANGLCVVAVKGFAQVNMDAATTLNDPIGSSATPKQGKDDNTLTNPQLILGYVMQALGAAGLGYAEIL